MLDLALVNHTLGKLDGFLYQPATAQAPGLLQANDSLLCFISVQADYVRLQAPVFYLDELETEDIRSDTAEQSDFYEEEVEQLGYFLEVNRPAGASRGMSVCLDDESGAVMLSCKALRAVLTEHGLQQLVHALFKLVLQQRVARFPDEVDPALVRLVEDDTDDGSGRADLTRYPTLPSAGV